MQVAMVGVEGKDEGLVGNGQRFGGNLGFRFGRKGNFIIYLPDEELPSSAYRLTLSITHCPLGYFFYKDDIFIF